MERWEIQKGPVTSARSQYQLRQLVKRRGPIGGGPRRTPRHIGMMPVGGGHPNGGWHHRGEYLRFLPQIVTMRKIVPDHHRLLLAGDWVSVWLGAALLVAHPGWAPLICLPAISE
jgi:hypothetical protein